MDFAKKTASIKMKAGQTLSKDAMQKALKKQGYGGTVASK